MDSSARKHAVQQTKRVAMTAPSSTPRTSRKCCTPSDRPCKRLKMANAPETDSDVTHDTFDNENSDDRFDGGKSIVEALPDDLLGAIFFGGFVDSLEVVNTTSCISKGAMALAETHVKMLDLRKCSKLTSAKLSFVVNRFPHLQVSNTESIGFCVFAHVRIHSIYRSLTLATAEE